jgi:hypothetical protein
MTARKRAIQAETPPRTCAEIPPARAFAMFQRNRKTSTSEMETRFFMPEMPKVLRGDDANFLGRKLKLLSLTEEHDG